MSRNPYHFTSQCEQDTELLGAALAEVVPDGTTVALYGTLGAGKTRLTQAFAVACGAARQDVTSPTFVLCQHYHATRMIHHLDAYRISDEDEFLALGPEEYFESTGITILEWADRVQACLPTERLDIHVDVIDKNSRTFRIAAQGDRLLGVIESLQGTIQRRRLLRSGALQQGET